MLYLIMSMLPGLVFAQNVLLPADYLTLIQQKVNSSIVYPTVAKLKGWEGIAKVRFTLAEDGRIKEIDIAESSGYPLLDATAIMAVKDASPYPFPSEYPEKEIQIIVPVNYGGVSLSKQPSPGQTYPNSSTNKELAIEPPGGTAYPTLRKYFGSKFSEKVLYSSQELNGFIDLAIAKNPPIKVAQEEIELAYLKLTESQRNFLPALKISNYYTDGEVFKVGYEERETKFQVDQPIYYSGRLQDTVRQAQVNLEINQKNYDRLKLDIVQKTEAAYFNLVASRMHLREKEVLRKEAEELLQKVTQLGKTGMVIPLEVNSAKSWYEQIVNQVENVQHEINMAELTFKQVLNVAELPKLQSNTLEIKKVDLDLNTCVEVAFQNRPEIHLSELLTKFNDYSQKIEDSKSKFTVDLTTSYGMYEGHYKTEPWRDSTNWYAGFKVSKLWGANTINSSLTHEQSQPRFGQTSPTEGTTFNTEFNLLDNLKLFSDKKRAAIDYSRSLSDFNETLKTVIFEVQDSYLKYKRALSQLDASEIEMNYRRNEAEITKVRSLVGDSSLSNAIESIFALSDAQTRYIQALANYYISLANLKKATGYGINI